MIPVEFGENETMDQQIQVEAIPKNIDFTPSVASFNQVISYVKA